MDEDRDSFCQSMAIHLLVVTGVSRTRRAPSRCVSCLKVGDRQWDFANTGADMGACAVLIVFCCCVPGNSPPVVAQAEARTLVIPCQCLSANVPPGDVQNFEGWLSGEGRRQALSCHINFSTAHVPPGGVQNFKRGPRHTNMS